MLPQPDQQILEWARKKRYNIGPMIWNPIHQLEASLERKLGFEQELTERDLHNHQFFFSASGRNASKVQKIEDKGFCYERCIYLPKGVVKYQFSDFDRSIDSEEELQEFLRQNKHYLNKVLWQLGHETNWDELNERERKDSSIVQGKLVFDSKGRVYSFLLERTPKGYRKPSILKELEGEDLPEFYFLPVFYLPGWNTIDSDYIRELLIRIDRFEPEF